MKKKTVFTIIGILIVVLCILFGLIFYKQKIGKDITVKGNGNDVTRYEWLERLCEYAGMTESHTETPYFKDVKPDNTYFSYIQSAVEWEVLQEADKFQGESYASGEFVALTAIRSLGAEKLQIYFETNEEIKDKECIALAIDNGLIKNEELKKGVSEKRCEEILSNLGDLYWNEISTKKYSDIVYQDKVIQIPIEDIMECDKDYSQIKVSDEITSKLETGTVVILEQGSSGLKCAREVSHIDKNGMISLKNAALEKTIQTMTISDTSNISFEDIINYYGLNQSSNSMQYQVLSLVNRNSNYQAKPMLDKKVQYTSEGFTLALSTEDNELSVTIINNATEEEYELPVEIELEEGNDWKATINMDKLAVTAQVKYSATAGVQYADVGVESHSTINGEAKLFSKDKKVKLMTAPFPMAGGLINIDINLYLVLSVEGNISLEVEVPFQTSVQYVKGTGLRHIVNNPEVEPKEIKVDCEANASIRDEAILSILQCIDVMNVQEDIGLEAAVEAVVRPNAQVCMNEAIYAPIISMNICSEDEETLLGELGVSAKWELINDENAPFKLQLHLEIMPDGTSQIVKECTYKEESIDNITYETKYATANNVNCPTFYFDYPSNWTVSNEEMDTDLCNETVVISSGRGVNVTYKDFSVTDLSAIGANGHSYQEAEVNKVADSDFSPSYTDQNYSNVNYVVAKIKVTKEMEAGVDEDWVEVDGATYYAVVPDNISKKVTMNGYLGFYEKLSFIYPTPHVFIADAPDGKFTEEEEKEVIAILSSFRVKTNAIQTNDPIYDALVEGDFSYFAGTYKACGAYADMYGGGEDINNMILHDNGIITGGGLSFLPDMYPTSAPVSVKKQEDGSYLCQVTYIDDSLQNYFLIYPEGTIGDNPYIYNDPFLTEHVYIQYMQFDGGVMDIIYYKIDE